jgi:hypothetical protein
MSTNHIHTDFEAAFTPGARFQSEHTVFTAGPILPLSFFRTPSGRIAICDPVDVQNFPTAALLRTVAPGSYPAFLACATSYDGVHRMSTCAKIQFTDEPIVEWQLATRPTDDPGVIASGGNLGFQMASGISCFAAAEFVADPHRLEFTKNYLTWWDQEIYKRRPEWSLGEFTDPRVPQGNVLAFHSGDHDGEAVGWWGLDAAGNAAQLAIDFGVLTELVLAEQDFPLAPLMGVGATIHFQGRDYHARLISDGNQPEGSIFELLGDFDWPMDISVLICPSPDHEMAGGVHYTETSNRNFINLSPDSLRAGIARLSMCTGLRRLTRID